MCGVAFDVSRLADVTQVLKFASQLDPFQVGLVIEALVADRETTQRMFSHFFDALGFGRSEPSEGVLYILTTQDLAQVLAEMVAIRQLDPTVAIVNAEIIFRNVQMFLCLDYHDEMARLVMFACGLDPENNPSASC
jgi:hypothetical protein